MLTDRLSNLHIGGRCVIDTIKVDFPLLSRLQDVGFSPGVEVQCVCIAPSGSPMAFRVKGSTIALRKVDCEKIGVICGV